MVHQRGKRKDLGDGFCIYRSRLDGFSKVDLFYLQMIVEILCATNTVDSTLTMLSLLSSQTEQ